MTTAQTQTRTARQRALDVLTRGEVAMLADWLDRTSIERIARRRRMDACDARRALEWALYKLQLAGFPVEQPERATLSYVDPDELDRRPARAEAEEA